MWASPEGKARYVMFESLNRAPAYRPTTPRATISFMISELPA